MKLQTKKHHRKSQRRHTIGGINGGVSHGIKKPRLKNNSNVKQINNNIKAINDMQNSMKMQENLLKEIENTDTSSMVPVQGSPLQEIDCNKRFFKSKQSAAIVTISNNIKLKMVSNGKLELNQKKNRRAKQVHKRTKPANISFDIADLMVDEPEVEQTAVQSNIENILKVLEDDWADDDYDTMNMEVNKQYPNVSPLKPVAILKDVIISPATELTDITSATTITDISASRISENIFIDDNEKKTDENIINTEDNAPEAFEDISTDNDKKSGENETEVKYYPLFNKEHSTKVFNEIDNKSMHNKKEAKSWQLSVKINGDDNQYQLDAGQKNFGATHCMECGVIYQIGDPEDENDHLNYHNNKKLLKFSGWKTERVIMEDSFTSSRIILIEPNDPKQCWKKVAEVLAYVNRDLGLDDTKLSNYEQKRVYLYVRNKVILGVLVAEHITTAHRMIPDLLELNCCTAESSPAKCGINVVWTEINHRRQGIATKLVNILRSNFYFGYIMSLDDIAFSIPTPSGKIFAEKYTKTRNFKVYT